MFRELLIKEVILIKAQARTLALLGVMLSLSKYEQARLIKAQARRLPAAGGLAPLVPLVAARGII